MEAKAVVRNISMSPRKMRVVTNTIRDLIRDGGDRRVEPILSSLRFTPKKAARIIEKALVSAAANAEDKSGGEVDIDALVIERIYVDAGTINKRWMPRAMGRGNRINHRTSHLTIVVSDEQQDEFDASEGQE